MFDYNYINIKYKLIFFYYEDLLFSLFEFVWKR